MDHPRIGVAVIVYDGSRVLLGRRKNAHGGGTWCFPGGHLEYGESLEECAVREVEEETGLRIKEPVPGPYTNDVFHAEKKHYVTVFLLAKHQGGVPEVREPEKSEQWKWFDWSDLPAPLFLPIQNLIKQGFQLPHCQGLKK